MKTVDVGAVLDEGRWTGYQKLLVFGTALTIILDGVDNQLLPNTVPTLIKEWGQPRPAFVNALAAGPFGMTEIIGTAFLIAYRLSRIMSGCRHSLTRAHRDQCCGADTGPDTSGPSYSLQGVDQSLATEPHRR